MDQTKQNEEDDAILEATDFLPDEVTAPARCESVLDLVSKWNRLIESITIENRPVVNLEPTGFTVMYPSTANKSAASMVYTYGKDRAQYGLESALRRAISILEAGLAGHEWCDPRTTRM